MPTIEAFPSGPIKSCVDFNRDGKIDLIATVIEPESAGQNNSSVTLFLNRADRANAIRGRLWNDLNKNQVFDLNESPIGGRYVWPDQDDNGVITFESDPQGVFTDADGTYELFVPNGTSIIRQLLPAGWVQTDRFSSPGFKPTAYNISISGLAVTSGWDFGSYYLGTVSGRVFNDYNANRSLDPVESGLAGWRVFSDTNGNSTYEVGEPTAVSNASGDYQISNVFPRAVKVRIVKPAGYEFTQPVSIAGADAFYDANVYGGFPGANTDVGLINPALVSGRVFNDINADGIVQAGENGLPSIFVAIDYNGVSVLLGLGDGTFADAVNYAAVVSTYGVAVADFNNDNNLDIVAAGPFDTRFALLTGTGDGTFSPAVLFDTEFGGLSIAAGDTNADGKRDVVIANRDDSSISIHRGNGIGTFAPRIRTTSGIVQPTFVTLADVNADSRLDLVYLNEPSNRVAVRLANGTGGFAGAKLFATTASPQQVAVIDVDRDGKLDLVVAGRSDGGTDISGGVSILRGNGDGTFQSQRVATAHTSPTAVAIADFNGDTKLDIVALNFFSADASLLFNGTPGRLGAIAGVAFNDKNLNGIKNVADGGLANQTIFVDINNNSILDPGERSTTTSGDGAFLLSDLPAGSYRIKAESTPAFAPTRPKNQVSWMVTVGEGQSVTVDDIGLAPTQKSGGFEYDNNSATLTGAWPVNSAVTGFIGNNYLTDLNAGKGTKSVRYSAMLPQDGYYEVLARWTSGSDRATNVPIDVVSASNSRIVTVNQTVNGGKWVSLGVYPFKRDVAGAVIIRNTQTNGLVIADGVRFVPVPDPFTVIRDNPNATVTGAWTTLTTPTTQRYNANYLSDENPAIKGNHSVTYKSGALATSGTYEIFGWWTASSVNASNALYTLTTASTTSAIRANQKLNGGQWVSLGYFELATTGATLTLSNQGANGRIIADAVRFVRVS